MTDPAGDDLDTLTALLRHFDWAPHAGVPGAYEVWSPITDPEYAEILLPLNPERADFQVLLGKALRQVLTEYGNSASETLATLKIKATASLDSTQWRKETSLNAGLINWQTGEALYAAARNQLQASAKSAKEDRRYHGNANSHVAKRFLESTLMGQSGIGSYVITALTPANQRFYLSRATEDRAIDSGQAVLDSATLSGRDILDTFQNALAAVTGVLAQFRNEPRLELFLDVVDDGVSFELAKALAEFATAGDADISIKRYDSAREVLVDAKYEFTSADAAILTSAANLLGLNSDSEFVTITGEVTLLSRSSHDPARLIRLDIQSGTTVSKARVRLTAEQYEIAMAAHQEELSLKVSGQLEREGPYYWLYNADEVSIVDPSSQQTAELTAAPAELALFEDL